jgi:hypothetical protein
VRASGYSPFKRAVTSGARAADGFTMARDYTLF